MMLCFSVALVTALHVTRGVGGVWAVETTSVPPAVTKVRPLLRRAAPGRRRGPAVLLWAPGGARMSRFSTTGSPILSEHVRHACC